jgi:hypothetical protein
MGEPMGEQIAAHDEYLRLVEELAASTEAGDASAVARIRPQVAAAKRRWHALSQRSAAVMRSQRNDQP